MKTEYKDKQLNTWVATDDEVKHGGREWKVNDTRHAGERWTAEETNMTIEELKKNEHFLAYLRDFIRGNAEGKDWASTVVITSAEVPIMFMVLQGVGKAHKFLRGKNFLKQLAEIVKNKPCSGILLDNIWVSMNPKVRPSNCPDRTSAVMIHEFEFDGSKLTVTNSLVCSKPVEPVKVEPVKLTKAEKETAKELRARLRCKIIATYAIGVIGEDQPFVYNDLLPNPSIERLIGYCMQANARPVAYVTVRKDDHFKNGEPQYCYTYFNPKDDGCACNGGMHAPAHAGDDAIVAGALEYIMKGSKGTGILPVRAKAEKNFAAAGK